MDRILVVVFKTESKACEAQKALLELEKEGSIVVYADALVAKNADGAATVRLTHDQRPLGGLPGIALGSAVEHRSPADMNDVRVAGDFIDDVSKELRPNRFAIVAEIQEDWTAPVDTRMDALRGFVFRRTLCDVKHGADDDDMTRAKVQLFKAKAAATQH
jgi:uncharacterized membrane protein